MRVIVTGASGFLGWHVQTYLRAHSPHSIISAARSNWSRLHDLVGSEAAVIHLAGVNRGGDVDVSAGNICLAQDVAQLVRTGRITRLVFANSIQSVNSTPYGRSKAEASQILGAAARDVGIPYTDVHLPNLFGEHGRPHYNSFVPTFIEHLRTGSSPTVEDRAIELLHAQDAAKVLVTALEAKDGQEYRPAGVNSSVAHVLTRLAYFHQTYGRRRVIPDLEDAFDLRLFNTYRAAFSPAELPFQLTKNADKRGEFIELVRTLANESQSSFSVTVPGATRGNHFHLRKIERFVVMAGRGRIALRRLFTAQTHVFDVDGDRPVAIDMPTGWAHSLENTGRENLYCHFWISEVYRENDADTFPEVAALERTGA